jgi:TRAP-type C4-dicarboxylate transport system permease small subunit
VPDIFYRIEKIKWVYDKIYDVVMFICKVLLIIDIIVTTITVLGRYVPFISDPSWSEEVILTLMTYMSVLSAALAIRKSSHIRMTAFDKYLPKKLIISLDILADFAVLILAFIMLIVGWKYANGIGGKGTYISMPSLSKFWMYFPVPLAGLGMILFELESIYKHIRSFYVREGEDK